MNVIKGDEIMRFYKTFFSQNSYKQRCPGSGIFSVPQLKILAPAPGQLSLQVASCTNQLVFYYSRDV